MAKPEGFRAVLTDQGTEGALLTLAQKVEELSARVAALDTRPQALTAAEEDKARQQFPPSAPPPPPLPASEPGKSEATNG